MCDVVPVRAIGLISVADSELYVVMNWNDNSVAPSDANLASKFAGKLPSVIVSQFTFYCRENTL